MRIVTQLWDEKFKYHDELKNSLLSEINKTDNTFSTNKISKISRLDWHASTNMSRPWVKIIYDKLQEHFNKCVNELNYNKVVITNLWFQQYEEKDIHDWHVHGDNYTGVYYLDFPEGAPKTELRDHVDNYLTLDSKEGHIVMFPSFFIHRSPLAGIKKTIISFNINLRINE